MHEIETHGTAAAAAFAGRPAWHGLGQVVTDAMSVDEAMALAHLGGWNVHTVPKRQLVTIPAEVTDDGVTPEHDIVVASDRDQTVLRTNPFTGELEDLGTVGRVYDAIQNEETALYLQTLTDEGGANIQTAGSLDGGRRTFVTMKAPEDLMIGGIDALSLYIVCLNSHDGSQAFTTLATPVRVVCANTERAAIGNNAGIFKVKHTRKATQQIAEARQKLDMTFKYGEAFTVAAERMLDTPMSVDRFAVVSKEVIRDPSRRANRDLTERQQRNDATKLAGLTAAFTGPLNANIAGTAWAGYNAWTEYLDHSMSINNPDHRDEQALRAERSMLGGSGLEGLKTRAFAAFALAGTRS